MTVNIQLYHGDCLEVMKDISDVSVIITDPPYPDYHTDKYKQTDIGFLNESKCHQLIFWSAKCTFPLDYSAIHIWDKKTGCGSQYERIFERLGGNAYKVFNHYLINSTVAAKYTGDRFTGHPSQKPIKLLVELIEHFTNQGNTIFDPFM